MVNRDHETGSVVISVVALTFLNSFTNEKSGNALVGQRYAAVVGSNKMKKVSIHWVQCVMYADPFIR